MLFVRSTGWHWISKLCTRSQLGLRSILDQGIAATVHRLRASKTPWQATGTIAYSRYPPRLELVSTTFTPWRATGYIAYSRCCCCCCFPTFLHTEQRILVTSFFLFYTSQRLHETCRRRSFAISMEVANYERRSSNPELKDAGGKREGGRATHRQQARRQQAPGRGGGGGGRGEGAPRTLLAKRFLFCFDRD